MRSNLTRGIGLGALLVCMTSGCDPAPVNDSRFWTGRSDAGASTVTTPGSGGSSETGGSGVVTGSGGDSSSGGSPGSGGAPAAGGAGVSGNSGGATGSGGSVGSGGRTGSGGGTASGGSFGSGGSTGTGGSQGTGGRGATGGAVGSGGASTGGASTGGAVGSGGSSVLTGMLNVSVTTKAAGGQYAPDNVGAIWIADSGSKFVKSLYVWGSQRRKELSSWNSATSAAGLASNLVDAVTAATMTGHGVRTATWNGTNTSKALVADGAYKVCFELRDGSGGSQCVDFSKSRTAQTVSPADTTTFTKRTIGYTP